MAKHGDEEGYPEAIEARYQLYRGTFALQPPDPSNQTVGFISGVAAAIYDIGKGTATGLYSLFTTNPVTTARNMGLGIAETIDAAIMAEDTPAYIHLAGAVNSIAQASAHDVGYGVGIIAGNVGLAAAPGAVAAKISALRRAKAIGAALPTTRAPKIIWVDENTGLKGLAKDYNDSAMGARSNVLTKRGQVPALERTMPDGTMRLVKFDGVDGSTMIDRKWSIVTTQKAKDQALRQSEVLLQHSLTGLWEVPTRTQQNRAVKMLKELGVSNVEVKVSLPW